MRRFLRPASALIILAFCGGETVADQPPGHAGDDGGYFLPDGAAAFAPGAGCEGYDVSRFSRISALQAISQFLCSNASDCVAPAENQLPPGDAFLAICGGGDQHFCEFNNNVNGASWIPSDYCPNGVWSEKLKCRPGPDGDAFCSAYYNQFVLGAGFTTAKCIVDCSNSDPVDPGVCMPTPPTTCWTFDGGNFGTTCDGGTCTGGCDQLDFCVTRGTETHCEHPCLPSP